MKDMYEISGITKQAYHQGRQRQEHQNRVREDVLSILSKIRQEHKKMGCRRMYRVEGAKYPIGRDAVEQVGFANGFKLKRRRNPVKTTWGQKVEVYPNLLNGKILNNINQAWQSDIFYLKVESIDYYVVEIMDVYSRKLLALHASKSLMAMENIAALKQALNNRKGMIIKGCIFHSDRGSQYISKVHKQIVKDYEMQISMAKLPQENAYAERINGILKYEYFFEEQLTRANINKKSKMIMKKYNEKRPHSQLNWMTPTAFEQKIAKIADNLHPKLIVHNWDTGLSTEYQVVNKEKSSKKENLPNI